MSSPVCTGCAGFEKEFDQRIARKELREYRVHGPAKRTKVIIDYLVEHGIQDLSLLDIGGGVGVIQHELLKHGLSHVVNVDASGAYQETVKEEAALHGFQDKIQFFFGDFVTLSDQVSDADIVILERVICCYRDMDQLVRKSIARATSYFVVVYPHNSLLMRIGFSLLNFYYRFARDGFKIYHHPQNDLYSIIYAHNFRQVLRTGVGRLERWWVEIYKKESS